VTLFLATTWLWTAPAPLTAQSLEQRLESNYRTALLDSAIKLEILKPRLMALEKSYGFLKDENMAIKNQQRFLSFQAQEQKHNFEKQLADQRKKRRRGAAAALMIGLVLGALIF